MKGRLEHIMSLHKDLRMSEFSGEWILSSYVRSQEVPHCQRAQNECMKESNVQLAESEEYKKDTSKQAMDRESLNTPYWGYWRKWETASPSISIENKQM